jgi:toxin ParE1/3/4
MPRAERNLESIFTYIRAESSPVAEAWLNGLVEAISSLSELPLCNPRTPEARELRHLLYGARPHIYRVIYAIDKPRQRVNILHIRHHSRDAFRPPELQ